MGIFEKSICNEILNEILFSPSSQNLAREKNHNLTFTYYITTHTQTHIDVRFRFDLLLLLRQNIFPEIKTIT